jgi:hypothetical protein
VTFVVGMKVLIGHRPCHTDLLRLDLIVHLSADVNCRLSCDCVDMIWGRENHVPRQVLRSLEHCMWRGALYDRHSLSPTPDTIGLESDIVVRATR